LIDTGWSGGSVQRRPDGIAFSGFEEEGIDLDGADTADDRVVIERSTSPIR
jgi:hypothetical protein